MKVNDERGSASLSGETALQSAMYSAPAHTLIQRRAQGRHHVLAAFLIGWRKSAVRKRRHQGKRICKQDFSEPGGTIIPLRLDHRRNRSGRTRDLWAKPAVTWAQAHKR